MNGEGPVDLRRRTRRFAVRSIHLSKLIERSDEGSIIRRQFLRSATSVGAQYREACRARSDAEFISKLESSSQELDETQYWLELLIEAKLAEHDQLIDLLDEADQLIRIFTTIVKNRKAAQ